MSEGRQIKRRKTNIQRKRKFNRQNRVLIYDAIKSELPISRALGLIGINRSTFYRWVKMGKDSNYPIHRRFRKKVKMIHAQIQLNKLQIILDAASGITIQKSHVIVNRKKGRSVKVTVEEIPPSWKAAVWFLERRFPNEYGNNRLQVPDATPHEIAANIKASYETLTNSVPVFP